MLEQTFIDLILQYSKDQKLANKLWKEIELHYSSKDRHYHTLKHLENLLIQLLAVKNELVNWNCILFTLFYHDIIYFATKKNNEEKSAAFAKKIAIQLSIPAPIIAKCENQILATKNHNKNSDSDTNFFTDADLSILGQDWDLYANYYKNVRKEYSIFPDFLYNNGRKKVLKHFLAMEQIFKTNYFYNQFEIKARSNLQKEFDLL